MVIPRNHLDAGLSLLDDINSVARGFCAVLPRELVAHQRSLSFTYGRPVESWSSLVQVYFGNQLEGKPNKFVLEPLNFTDDAVSEVTIIEIEPYSKKGRTHCL